MKVLVIKPDTSSSVVDVNEAGGAFLLWLQATVCGYIEHFSAKGNWHGYCNEEGKLQGLPVNPTATFLARELGWNEYGVDVLVGTCVFLGNGKDGEEADVPEWLVDEYRRFLS